MSTESEVVDKFKETFEKKDMSILDPYLADDMTFQLLPSSVGSKMTKDEWKGKMKIMFGIIKSFEFESTTVTAHPLFAVARTNISLALDFPGGDFTQEILLLFNFSKDESGALKIASATEWVDSFRVKEWKAKMGDILPPSQ